MAGTFVIESGKTGKFRFNLKAANNHVILSSETYSTKASAENGIDAVRTNATDGTAFQRKRAKNGSPYFVIRATNGETIGRSEMYTSTSAMERGIKSVAVNAPGARVIDRST